MLMWSWGTHLPASIPNISSQLVLKSLKIWLSKLLFIVTHFINKRPDRYREFLKNAFFYLFLFFSSYSIFSKYHRH